VIISYETAYPVMAFPELDDDEWAYIHERIGKSMTSRLHASWGRHIIQSIMRMAKENEDEGT